MKTNLIVCGIIFLFILSCNSKKDEPSKQIHTDSTSVVETTEHNEMTLALNDGKKWKIDEPTRININEIKQSFQKYSSQVKPDHKALAAELQQKADKLISECKMTGKDHEMLHVWLENFLTELKELRSTELTKQEAAFHKIDELIKNFDEYFE